MIASVIFDSLSLIRAEAPLAIDLDTLRSVEAALPQPTILDALTRAEGFAEPSSRTAPRAFVCSDALVYWVKSQAANGLEAELICGRLANLTGAGPMARPVNVSDAALASLGTQGNVVVGVGVGSEDVRGAVNARDLGQLPGGGITDPTVVSQESRALATTFQTWVGVSDEQVLVSLPTGRILSIDHEEACRIEDASKPTIKFVSISGLPDDHGRQAQDVLAAVSRIEALSEEQILVAVSCIPSGAHWNGDEGRRLAIAEWLLTRRSQLADVMKQWMLP